MAFLKSVSGPEPCPCCKQFHQYGKFAIERMRDWAEEKLKLWEPPTDQPKCCLCNDENLHKYNGKGLWNAMGGKYFDPCPCSCHTPTGASKVCPTCGLTENGMTPEAEKAILREVEEAKADTPEGGAMYAQAKHPEHVCVGSCARCMRLLIDKGDWKEAYGALLCCLLDGLPNGDSSRRVQLERLRRFLQRD